MAVRIGVGEGRVVHHLDAVELAVDEEQRGQALAVHEGARHHDVHRRDVAVGHEPLLAVDRPAALRARGRGLDPRGVGARLRLGDRVGVVQLAAQRRLQVALDLLGRAAGEHVVGAGHVPRQRVRRAPELLLDEEPLRLRPALAAVLARVQAARQAGSDRLALDPLLQLVGDPAAASLRQLLVRDQQLVDEAAGALPEVELLRREVGGRERRRGRGADGHRGPPLCLVERVRRARPRARLSWFSITSSITALGRRPRPRAHARARGLAQVREPGAPGAVQHDPLRTRALALDQLVRRGTAARAALRARGAVPARVPG